MLSSISWHIVDFSHPKKNQLPKNLSIKSDSKIFPLNVDLTEFWLKFNFFAQNIVFLPIR